MKGDGEMAEIKPHEIQVGDVIRFRPSGYRNRIVFSVTRVREDVSFGDTLVTGYRARAETDTLPDGSRRLVVITRGEECHHGIRQQVELLRRCAIPRS